MWSFEEGDGGPDRIQPLRILLGTFIASLLLFGLANSARCDWQIVPELRLSGGAESDQVIDPSLTRVIIPGGAFAEITPDMMARRWLGRRTLMSTGTFATLQHFLNDQSRLLYAQTAWGNIVRNFSGSIRGRWSLSADFFNDSEREAVRRMGVGTELGVMLVRSAWSVDFWGGVRGRRYPELAVRLDSAGVDTYEEGVWSGGATIRIAPVADTYLSAGGTFQSTDSRDPTFDSNSITVSGDVDIRLVSSVFLTAFGAYQERRFTQRPAGEDSDEYLQVGLGLRYLVVPGLEVSARWGIARYTWPGGEFEDTQRITLGIAYGWGRRDVLPMPALDVEALTRSSGGSVQQADRDGKIRLRILAPGAEAVAVTGSFNGWNPDAVRLHAADGGWWEARIELPPGIYEYAYVIDGKWTTPPEAKITIDDGFGGKNGILEVLPGEL